MLSCNNAVKNVGTLVEGTMAKIEFDFVNSGQQPYILTTSSSCGCSTPIIPKHTINPGESMTLLVNFDTMGKKGLQVKEAYVYYVEEGKSNTANQRLTCKFTADVVKAN